MMRMVAGWFREAGGGSGSRAKFGQGRLAGVEEDGGSGGKGWGVGEREAATGVAVGIGRRKMNSVVGRIEKFE